MKQHLWETLITGLLTEYCFRSFILSFQTSSSLIYQNIIVLLCEIVMVNCPYMFLDYNQIPKAKLHVVKRSWTDAFTLLLFDFYLLDACTLKYRTIVNVHTKIYIALLNKCIPLSITQTAYQYMLHSTFNYTDI